MLGWKQHQIRASTEPVVNTIEDITLSKIPEKSLDSIKKGEIQS